MGTVHVVGADALAPVVRVGATLAALGTVSGVGAAKLERYGESLLAALHA